jgi:hypothetical protein
VRRKVSAVTSEDNTRADRVASLILRYLTQNPSAADTLEGIRTWWLRGQGCDPPKAVVARALQSLVDKEEIIRIGVPPNSIYRRHPGPAGGPSACESS